MSITVRKTSFQLLLLLRLSISFYSFVLNSREGKLDVSKMTDGCANEQVLQVQAKTCCATSRRITKVASMLQKCPHNSQFLQYDVGVSEQSFKSNSTRNTSFQTRIFPGNWLHSYWQGALKITKKSYQKEMLVLINVKISLPRQQAEVQWQVSISAIRQCKCMHRHSEERTVVKLNDHSISYKPNNDNLLYRAWGLPSFTHPISRAMTPLSCVITLSLHQSGLNPAMDLCQKSAL